MPEFPVLTCMTGPLKHRRFAITEAGLRIGREPGNEIRIGDKGISRQHARVILHNGLLWVQDMGSRNGVFVNEVRVQNQGQANVGDTVRVGVHVFRIDLEREQAGDSQSPAEKRDEIVPPDAATVTLIAGPDSPEKFNKWPLIVALIVVALLVGAVALVGAGSGKAWPSS